MKAFWLQHWHKIVFIFTLTAVVSYSGVTQNLQSDVLLTSQEGTSSPSAEGPGGITFGPGDGGTTIEGDISAGGDVTVGSGSDTSIEGTVATGDDTDVDAGSDVNVVGDVSSDANVTAPSSVDTSIGGTIATADNTADVNAGGNVTVGGDISAGTGGDVVQPTTPICPPSQSAEVEQLLEQLATQGEFIEDFQNQLDEKQSLIDAAQLEIESLQAQLDDCDKDKNDLVQENASLQSQLDALQAQLDAKDLELAQKDTEIENLNTLITTLEGGSDDESTAALADALQQLTFAQGEQVKAEANLAQAQLDLNACEQDADALRAAAKNTVDDPGVPILPPIEEDPVCPVMSQKECSELYTLDECPSFVRVEQLYVLDDTLAAALKDGSSQVIESNDPFVSLGEQFKTYHWQLMHVYPKGAHEIVASGGAQVVRVGETDRHEVYGVGVPHAMSFAERNNITFTIDGDDEVLSRLGVGRTYVRSFSLDERGLTDERYKVRFGPGNGCVDDLTVSSGKVLKQVDASGCSYLIQVPSSSDTVRLSFGDYESFTFKLSHYLDTFQVLDGLVNYDDVTKTVGAYNKLLNDVTRLLASFIKGVNVVNPNVYNLK